MSNPIMPRWEVAKAGPPPMDAAFHDGAIRYLKEKGLWTSEADAWQAKIVKRHKALQAAWAQMMAKDPAAQDRSSCGPAQDLGTASRRGAEVALVRRSGRVAVVVTPRLALWARADAGGRTRLQAPVLDSSI